MKKKRKDNPPYGVDHLYDVMDFYKKRRKRLGHPDPNPRRKKR